MAITTPVNQVLLTIPQAFQEELITDSGLKLFLDPSYNKEQNVAVVATVAALPIISSKKDNEILSQLYPGDVVAMSYQVVADFEFKGDGGQFMQSTEDDPYVREFINGKGETVKVYALPKRSGFEKLTWIGTYQNKRRELIDGVQGSEETVEKWLTQFPFGKIDCYTFNNLFSYEGKDYWKAYPDQIFAKKVNGHWVAVGDRVLCKPYEAEVPSEVLVGIQHKESVKIRYQDRAVVESYPKGTQFKKGQIVSFDPKKLERYKFENRDFYLINKKLINGIWKN